MLARVLGSLDPDTVLPYQIDLSAYFAAIGDRLDTATITVVDAADQPIASDLMVVQVQCAFTGQVTFWLTGGTAGQQYRVRCRFRGASTTPVQLQDDITVVIPVRQT
jgi:spore coat protein U-like protein